MNRNHPGRVLMSRAALDKRQELLSQEEAELFLDYYGLPRSDEDFDQVVDWLRVCMELVGEEVCTQVIQLLEDRIKRNLAIIVAAEDEAIARARAYYGTVG